MCWKASCALRGSDQEIACSAGLVMGCLLEKGSTVEGGRLHLAQEHLEADAAAASGQPLIGTQVNTELDSARTCMAHMHTCARHRRPGAACTMCI
jgi:hypothetical protein